MGNLDLLSLLATQPRKAFDALAERPRFWFPLLLTVVVGVVTTVWYYKVVDLQWLLDETLRSNPRTAAMTEDQRAQALQRMTPGVLMGSSVVAVALLVPLFRVLDTTYFLLATSGNGQIDSSAIQPLSLNELFFHRHMGDGGYQLLVSLSVLQPLAWLLSAIGVQQWSKRPWGFCAVFVLLPVVLIYGAWAWFSLR